nr:MAG TPA: hypothetical protein [Caudoviricetes sp.]
MSILTSLRFGVEVSPEGIAALCTDVPVSSRLAILNALERAWDESKAFDVEIEIPLDEHPHVHILDIAVDPVTQQFTIERRVGNDRLSSCPRCRLG